MAVATRKPISDRTRFLVLKLDKYCCRLCGASAQDGAKLEVDHRIPVSKGGANDLANLWTLCYQCNRGKSATMIKPGRDANNFFRSSGTLLLAAPKPPIALLPGPKQPARRKFNILKKIRAEADISLKDLSKATGVDQATISQLENDRRKAHLSTLAKLGRYFNRPIEDFEELLDNNGTERGRRGGLASVAAKKLEASNETAEPEQPINQVA